MRFKRTISPSNKNIYKACALCRSFCSDVFPLSEVKIIRKTKESSKNEEVTKKIPNDSDEFRVNAVNIQMISKNIYKQLFKDPPTEIDPNVIKSCQAHLLHHGINYKEYNKLPDVKLNLPKLEGKDIVEHFYNIGKKQSDPYKKLLHILATNKLPELPKIWLKSQGWTKYTLEGPKSVPCPPDDILIFDVEVLMAAGKRPTLACAVSTDAWYSWVSEPVASGKAHETFSEVNYEDLIPLETDGHKPCGDLNRPRIVVGHNVSYDRAKIKEQYWLERTGVRFMDTMSMHTCVSGVTSYQRTVLKAKNKEPDPADDDWIEISSLNSLSEVHKLYCGQPIDKQTRDIFVEGTLEDVHNNFQTLMSYCAGDVIATHNVLRELYPMFLERFPHPVTLAGMLELGTAYLPVNSNWTQYIDSAETVFNDYKLESQQLLSLKADEACRLMENEEYKKDLWMWDEDWSTQTLKLKKSTSKKTEMREDIILDKQIKTQDNFETLSERYIESLGANNGVKVTVREELVKKFQYLYDLRSSLPVKRPYLAGYPAWYRKLCTKPGKDPDWSPGANNITTSMQITPKLLRLSWEGYPLHYIKGEGWGFLVPYSRTRGELEEGEVPLPLETLLSSCPIVTCKGTEVSADTYVLPKTVEEDLSKRAYYARKRKLEQATANQYHGLGVWTGIGIQGCCHFLRLPHKDGAKYKVGNPLARDFLNMFSQNVLSAQGNDAEKVLTYGRMMSYWRNNRERVMGQQVVWLPEDVLPEHLRGSLRRYGAIIPQVVVCGTLTRRASEPTWMTASNATAERIGSELRALVQAPPNYRFVGADVDSQELWIAALLGDSGTRLCGGSAFGWAVLAGHRAAATDLHSLTARAAHVQRDHAKVINYARIYGAGQNFAERLLKQFNPTMTMSEAKSKAAKMFSTTKGRRVYTLKKKYMLGLMDEDIEDQKVEMTAYQAMRLAKMSGKQVEDMFERPRWVGGTESCMFNKLEDIADSMEPKTAFLEGRLSRALEHSAGRWGGTRLNWAVQSAAADFLHLMLVSMTHLAPKARFCLSFHDEVRYLVPEEHKYETALALQITNLFTRAFCSQRVGIKDLPLSVAFFTSVDVDQVLRKESNLSCMTPSNPHGLENGYGIPNGESLTIFDVLDKCKIKKE
ncbi:DNA polymerase subunit gamma-1, mitochondrial [Zerene cesonia]|uniref:DNA polymerase subunit gamma-1, mitochondrial n=1 Tax=Zerene cesonia TaxID=33412 RepID=UPI0018E5A7C7|nr:DNA polymerase subunit gamma-1, mitochondrial [Zerene cesonia]